MKNIKFIAAFLIAVFASQSYSYAKSGPYAGININRSRAEHKVSNMYGAPGTHETTIAFSSDRTETDATNVGFGFEAGYKFQLSNNGIYIAPEIYFDQLNNSAEDPYADNEGQTLYKQDKLILNYRYGAKLNLGYDFNEKYSAFVNYGFANVDYDVNWNSVLSNGVGAAYSSYGADKLAEIYGVGGAYNINENFALRLSYDMQKFNIRYMLDGWRSEVKLQTFKAGLIYNF